jgi:hypothetical protein
LPVTDLDLSKNRRNDIQPVGFLDGYWIYPSSPEIQWFIFPNVHGSRGKLAEFYHWKNREKTQPDAAEMSPNVEMYYF